MLRVTGMTKTIRELLACPVDRLALSGDTELHCPQGHSYPVVEGVPVLLHPDLPAIHSGITRTREAVSRGELPSGHWSFDGVTNCVDPVVQCIVAATNGMLYSDLVGKLHDYPIPDLRLPPGRGQRLLDVGCNWGRWSIAAARKGYNVVGVDPDLEALLAAKRVSRQLNIRATFIVGDARALPFLPSSFDRVFSYSVLQHFSKADALTAMREVGRVLATDGESFIQMPNAWGVRSAYHLARRRREARDFEVRYWRVEELRSAFTQVIGPSTVEIDGFFGLGIQPSDAPLMPLTHRAVIHASQGMRQLSRAIPPLKYVADSLYVRSRHATGASLT